MQTTTPPTTPPAEARYFQDQLLLGSVHRNGAVGAKEDLRPGGAIAPVLSSTYSGYPYDQELVHSPVRISPRISPAILAVSEAKDALISSLSTRLVGIEKLCKDTEDQCLIIEQSVREELADEMDLRMADLQLEIMAANMEDGAYVDREDFTGE